MLCKITNYSRGGSYYPGLHYSSSYSGASPDPKGKSGYASRQGATPAAVKILPRLVTAPAAFT